MAEVHYTGKEIWNVSEKTNTLKVVVTPTPNGIEEWNIRDKDPNFFKTTGKHIGDTNSVTVIGTEELETIWQAMRDDNPQLYWDITPEMLNEIDETWNAHFTNASEIPSTEGETAEIIGKVTDKSQISLGTDKYGKMPHEGGVDKNGYPMLNGDTVSDVNGDVCGTYNSETGEYTWNILPVMFYKCVPARTNTQVTDPISPTWVNKRDLEKLGMTDLEVMNEVIPIINENRGYYDEQGYLINPVTFRNGVGLSIPVLYDSVAYYYCTGDGIIGTRDSVSASLFKDLGFVWSNFAQSFSCDEDYTDSWKTELADYFGTTWYNIENQNVLIIGGTGFDDFNYPAITLPSGKVVKYTVNEFSTALFKKSNIKSFEGGALLVDKFIYVNGDSVFCNVDILRGWNSYPSGAYNTTYYDPDQGEVPGWYLTATAKSEAPYYWEKISGTGTEKPIENPETYYNNTDEPHQKTLTDSKEVEKTFNALVTGDILIYYDDFTYDPADDIQEYVHTKGTTPVLTTDEIKEARLNGGKHYVNINYIEYNDDPEPVGIPGILYVLTSKIVDMAAFETAVHKRWTGADVYVKTGKWVELDDGNDYTAIFNTGETGPISGFSY